MPNSIKFQRAGHGYSELPSTEFDPSQRHEGLGAGSKMGCDLAPKPTRAALKASRKPFKLRGLAGNFDAAALPQ